MPNLCYLPAQLVDLPTVWDFTFPQVGIVLFKVYTGLAFANLRLMACDDLFLNRRARIQVLERDDDEAANPLNQSMVRQGAIRALLSIGDPSALPALREALHKPIDKSDYMGIVAMREAIKALEAK